MGGKKRKKRKMKKKTFILMIVGVCAVALIAEIVLMTMIFSGRKNRNRVRHTTETGLITDTKGNAFRLMKYVEYGPSSAQMHEYAYDRYGRRTVERTYQAIRAEAGKKPPEADLTHALESEINYEYDKQDRMTKATVYDSTGKRIYTYEYDEEKGYLKNIYIGTEGSKDGIILERSFNERGLLMKQRNADGSYKSFELDECGHIIAEYREKESGDVLVFSHTLWYENPMYSEYEALTGRKINNNSTVEGIYGTTDTVEEVYTTDGRTVSAGGSTTYSYNAEGLLVGESHGGAEGIRRTIKYNEKRLIAEEKEKRGSYRNAATRTTAYEYGPEDRLLGKTLTVEEPLQEPVVTEWVYEYDRYGNPKTVRERKGDTERVSEEFTYACVDIPAKNFTQEDLRRKGASYDRKTRMDPKDSVFDMPVYYSEKRWGEAYYFAGR